MAGGSASATGVGSGSGFARGVNVHRDRVSRRWSRVSEAGWGDNGDSGEQTRGGGARHRSSDDGGTVRGLESFIGRAVLVHEDSEVIPGFRLGV